MVVDIDVQKWLYDFMFSALIAGEADKLHKEYDIDGLVQERRNSSALAMELRLSCTNP